MHTIAITCPPVPGHINPMLAVGAELQRRGHRVIVLNLTDVADQARRAGLEFVAIGGPEFPSGWLTSWQERLQKLSTDQGRSVRSAYRLLIDFAHVLLRDSPDIIRDQKISGLIVDQAEYFGATLADAQRLPYVAVANALPYNREPGVPSMFSPWQPKPGWLWRLRDRSICALQNQYYRWRVAPWINKQRVRLGLPAYRDESEHCATALAMLSQCPPAFDFARSELPATWHGVGPLRSDVVSSPPFPYERLDGRPIVYASLGSLQGGQRWLFAAIAQACATLCVQLVITHGYKLSDDETRAFAGDPIVVPFAPQLELLSRARVAITHAGMNTILDAMSACVPVVAIPITFEQPAIAARVDWHRTGEVVPVRRATADRIRSALVRVLDDPSYRAAAGRIGAAVAAGGGVRRAVDVIERAFATGQPVFAASS